MRKLWRSLDRLLWGRARIRRQMYMLYAVALLIPVTVIGVLLIVSAMRVLNSHYIELVEAANGRVRTFFGEVATQTYNISENISAYYGLQQILTGEYEESPDFSRAVNADGELDSIIYNRDEVAAIQIYSNNPGVYDYKQFRQVTDEVRSQEWYQRAVDSSGAFWAVMEGDFVSGSNNFCLVRQILLTDSDYSAVLVIRLSDRYLRSKLNSDILDAVALDEEGIVYSSASAWYGREQLIDIDYSDSYYRYSGTAQVDGREYFVALTTQTLYRTSSKLYVCSLSDSGFGVIDGIVRAWVAILLLAILIPGVIFLLFTKHLVRDIQEKDARMYQAELDRAELRNEQQIMEYKLLAGQINPHYLYNTLETIRMKALTGGDREVADAIKILGKTLRYVLENNGTISTTLRKELDYIESYLAIQKLRFGERIDYEVKIQNGLRTEEYRILPLLLQPVVENAVVHGLEDTGKNGRIVIEIEMEEGEGLRIAVSDNGRGMTPEELVQLKNKLDTPNLVLQANIGLYNINQRVHLCYGKDYGIRLESAPGQGTKVILLLPVNVENR